MRDNHKIPIITKRDFSNLLYGSASGRDLIKPNTGKIIEALKPVAQFAASDVSVAIALTTLYLNLSVYITGSPSDVKNSASHALELLSDLPQLLSSFPA